MLCTLLVDRIAVTLNPCKQLWSSNSERLSASVHLARTATVLGNPRSPRRPLHRLLALRVPYFLRFHLLGTYSDQGSVCSLLSLKVVQYRRSMWLYQTHTKFGFCGSLTTNDASRGECA